MMQNGRSILRSGSEAVSELFEPISKSTIKSFLRTWFGIPSPYPEFGSRLPLGNNARTQIAGNGSDASDGGGNEQ
jgi:hypothetical protein